MMTPMSHRVGLSTGLSYHVLQWGVQDASRDHTVVLIHGYLDICWVWEPLVEAGLGSSLHVIAPDMRGHGDSDRVGAGGFYHFADYVADLACLVDQLGRERVSLVGHSMGGNIAALFAGTFPQRVHRLALIEALVVPDDPTPAPDAAARWISEWKRVGRRAVRSYASVEHAAARLREADPLLTPEAARHSAERGTRMGEDGRVRFKHDPLHRIRGPRPFRVQTATEFYERIQCPVLVIDGAKSRFAPMHAQAARRADSFAVSRRVTLPEAGHTVQRHVPQQLADCLSKFLLEDEPVSPERPA